MRTINTIAIVSLLCFPISGFTGEVLNRDQLKETFSDSTFEWQHLFKSMYGKTYYAADGKVTGTKNGSKREGTWHISGSEICLSWGNCASIESDGNDTYYRSNGFKRVLRIKKLGDGNLL